MNFGAKRLFTKRLILIIVIGACMCALVYYSPTFFIRETQRPSYSHLPAGGTSVASWLLENRWRNAYRQENAVEIDYDSNGSTKGVTDMIDGKTAIAFTHAPLTAGQKAAAQAKAGTVLHIPAVLCAVVPIYNVIELKDKPPLKLTGEALADIFLGKIDKWNDPALQKLNESVDLPATKIEVVHRGDPSGTTVLFADYLFEASEAWRQKVGKAHDRIEWPTGVGVSRNLGVADSVYRTNGAIGFVDLLYANYGDLQYAAVQNRDKTGFIHADSESMTAAVQAMLPNIPDDLKFKLTNTPGKNSYPICGVVWAVCYQTEPAARQRMVVDFLRWANHKGQTLAKGVTYAALPEELVQRVDNRITLIQAAK